jgi:hypothetical protein
MLETKSVSGLGFFFQILEYLHMHNEIPWGSGPSLIPVFIYRVRGVAQW